MGATSIRTTLPIVWLFLLMACQKAPVETPFNKASLSTSGVVQLGDEVAIEYDLPKGLGGQLDLSSLPGIGVIDEELSIREIRVEPIAHKEPTEYRLHVVYQIFKSVKTPEVLIIPPIHFRYKGDPPQGFDSAPRSLMIEPAIPADTVLEQLDIGAPHPPRAKDTQRDLEHLLQWLSAFSATLCLILLRHWRHLKRSRPFQAIRRSCAKALRRRHRREGLEKAVRLIHRALNQTYGHSLFEKDLTRFFEENSKFSGVKTSLHDFFNLSDAVFYDPTFDVLHHPEAIDQLDGLLKALIEAERGRQR
jgi:mxaA protein